MPSARLWLVLCRVLQSQLPAQPIRTSSTLTAIMAAAPVDTVQSIRMTWSSLMSFGSRR